MPEKSEEITQLMTKQVSQEEDDEEGDKDLG
jgi:hypothetical protein